MERSEINLSTRITSGVLVLVFAVSALLYVFNSRVQEDVLREQQAQAAQVLQREKQMLSFTFDKLRRDVLYLAETPPTQGIARAAANRGIDPQDADSLQVWQDRLQATRIQF